MREAMRGRVPEAVRLNRVKSNVASFYYETLAGLDLEPIKRMLLGGKAEIGAYADPGKVAALLNKPPGVGGPGWYEWFSSVWGLATMEAWLRQQSDPGFAVRTVAEPDVLAPIGRDYRVRG